MYVYTEIYTLKLCIVTDLNFIEMKEKLMKTNPVQ